MSNLPRPNRHDAAVVAVAAQDLAKLICEEWDHDGKPEDWVEPLTKAANYWSDGYRLAKELGDYHHIEGDSQLVEVLDSASSILSDVHDFALGQWTKYTGYEPRFAEGDRVVSVRQGAGRINGVQAAKATYYFVPDSEAGTKFLQGGGYVLTDADLTPEQEQAA